MFFWEVYSCRIFDGLLWLTLVGHNRVIYVRILRNFFSFWKIILWFVTIWILHSWHAFIPCGNNAFFENLKSYSTCCEFIKLFCNVQLWCRSSGLFFFRLLVSKQRDFMSPMKAVCDLSSGDKHPCYSVDVQELSSWVIVHCVNSPLSLVLLWHV